MIRLRQSTFIFGFAGPGLSVISKSGVANVKVINPEEAGPVMEIDLWAPPPGVDPPINQFPCHPLEKNGVMR